MFFTRTKPFPHQYDVFNGDADGLCSLQQIRLTYPVENTNLVTGVKRDIQLLSKISDIRESAVLVLDVSLHSNVEYLERLLRAGNEIHYIDHHFAGDIPDSPQLKHRIDPSPDTCTSLIVNSLLNEKYFKWAICGAFGDNLHDAAIKLADKHSVAATDLDKLRTVGELINYNGYGSQLEDLYFPPDHLFQVMLDYNDPLDFHDNSDATKTLRLGFESDMNLAQSEPEFAHYGPNKIFRLPDSPWARRVSGVFANDQARKNPNGAHALITENKDGSLRISVRAPLNNKRGADELCRSFPTGGGRAAAAGINALPSDQLDSFLKTFDQTYS